MNVRRSCRDSGLKAFFTGQLLLIVVLLVTPPAFAQKTDLIFLHNGDQVTGEIKELERGQMRLSTNAFGTIFVKWKDVKRIVSSKHIQVEKIDGARYFGPAPASAEPNVLAMEIAGKIINIDMNQIVRLQPIKENQNFRGNLDNSLSIGFTYNKASDVMQWNVNADSKYRAEKYLATLSYDSMITNNGTGDDSARNDLTASYYRLRGGRWFLFGTGSFQKNDELGIDGRFLASGGVGRYLTQTTSQEFLVAAGLTGNWENSTGQQQSGNRYQSNSEGLLRASWSYFKLHTPKSDVNVALQFFPSITDSDRQRGDLRIRYKQEFIQDLFWNLTYFDSFDSKPPPGAISKRDYGIVTGIEYLF